MSIDRGGPRHEKGLGVSIRHGVVAAVAVAVASGGALSGCSDADSKPPDSGLPAESELTETPSSPSPTDASPTDRPRSGPQEPRLPAAAKAPGKAGAKAFVAYYIRLLNYASWTGDTEALGGGNARGCGGCASYADLYDATYQRGGWFKRGEWTPIAHSWLILSTHPGFLIDVKVDAAAGLQKLRRRGPVTRFLADTYQLDFHVARTANAWTVTRLETPA